METHEIKLSIASGTSADFDCPDGEICIASGAAPSAAGGIAAAPSPTVLAILPQGCRLLLEHYVSGGANWIVADGNAVLWLRKPYDTGRLINHSDMQRIAMAPAPITSAAALGEFACLATSAGVMHLAWTGEDYEWLGSAPEMPVLEFGLRKCGALAIDGAFEVPSAMSQPSSGGSGLGPSTTHPPVHPASDEEASSQSTSTKTVLNALKQAIAQQAEGKGLFVHPFFVRYALRLKGGKHIMPSAPALMLAPVVPPCLSIESVEAGGDEATSLVRFAASTIPIFELRCRIAQGLQEEWRGHIEAIDIFITAPVPTFDPEQSSSWGITDYQGVAEAGNTFVDRGRPAYGRFEDFDAYAGQWAVNGDDFADVWLSQMGIAAEEAWHLSPNASLMADIVASCADFYMVGSISAYEADDSDSFATLKIKSTAHAALRKCKRLESSDMTHTVAAPAIVHAHGGKLHCAGGGIFTPRQLPMGNAGVFPPFVYHPRRTAAFATIDYDGTLLKVPLAPHPHLEGAYWMATLAADPASEAEGTSDLALGPELQASQNTVHVSSAGAPFALERSFAVGNGGEITALRGAMIAMSQGQFGEYPLYAFTTAGIWAISSDYSRLGQVSLDRCDGERYAAATPHGVAYSCPRGIFLLQGTSSKDIGWRAQQEIPHLPGIEALGAPAAAFAARPDVPMLAYDSGSDLLWAFSGSGSASWAYSLASTGWTSMPATWSAPATSETVMRADGAILSMASHQDPNGEREITLITRPIKLSRPAKHKAITNIEAIGHIDTSHASMIFYGSNDLTHWYIAGSSRTSRLEPLSGSPWRYLIIALRARLSPSENIQAIRFTSLPSR